ncbi:MAG: thermonuclease family protein [Alphaproteobacteria bacterium]|nr:MAG: thermonuclease family protein [Alphaproteobacteria bacterium]
MRSRNLLFPIWSCFIVGVVLSFSPVGATTAIVRDGNAIQLGDITYRLDGIDAPELDQTCIDDHADPWTCGIEAREQLIKLIGGRPVRCDDLGAEKTTRKRHIGLCTVEGDAASLNQQLVRAGFALDFEPSAKGRFLQDEAGARDARLGLWKGCFVAPQEFRLGQKDGSLHGAACRTDRDRQIREALFPEDIAMPPTCSIKGKFAVRARVTGDVGIYHLRACPSYPAITKPDRWFCSEDDAQAAGFRRAYNCRAKNVSK